jgi:ABC-type phosphate transport system permease subunit
MSDNLMTGITTVVLGIIGLATIAVLVSKNAQTGNVIQAAASGLGNNIEAAVSPVTNAGGFGNSPNLAYPSGSSIT